MDHCWYKIKAMVISNRKLKEMSVGALCVSLCVIKADIHAYVLYTPAMEDYLWVAFDAIYTHKLSNTNK